MYQIVAGAKHMQYAIAGIRIKRSQEYITAEVERKNKDSYNTLREKVWYNAKSTKLSATFAEVIMKKVI